MVKAAIFILTQNTVERKIYLKTCLYFLFKNFDAKYKYPIIILHEDDYDETSQEEVTKSVREECRHLLQFKKVDQNDFMIPTHIDMEKMQNSIELQPVPYWRNARYRSMCYFWIKNFVKYTNGYDYIMRLDDDSIIEEPINTDLFELAKVKDINYLSNIIHIDCSMCNFEMKEFFSKHFPNSQDKIKEVFVDHKLNVNSPYFQNFKNLYKVVKGEEYHGTEVELSMPIMYYNNFCITRTGFWSKPEVQEIIDKIDKQGNIFYCRWGDAPLQTIIATLMDHSKISKVDFKYSKRLQRECFKDEKGVFHSFMPKTYDNNSCITKNKKA
jgi:alpha 1,2-mannosyltransferase